MLERCLAIFLCIYAWLSSYYGYVNYDCGSNYILRFICLYLDESIYNNVSKIEHHVCSSSNHKGCMFKSSQLETFCMCSVEKVCQLECYEDNQNVFTC